MTIQGEDGHLQAKERGCRRNQPCEHFDLRHLASETVRKYISVVYSPLSVVLGYGSPSRLIQVGIHPPEWNDGDVEEVSGYAMGTIYRT